MNTNRNFLNSCCLLTAGLALATCACRAEAEALRQETPATLQSLQDKLEQQTRRIDRLYRALGPQLEELEARADALRKQQEEDALLAMKPVFQIKDENFNSKLLFLPVSRKLALAGADQNIRLLALPQGKVEVTLTGAEGNIECLAATADGKQLFAGTDKGFIFAWSGEKDPAVKIASTGGYPVTAFALSPDGTCVAWACNGMNGTDGKWTQPDESLVMVDTATGRRLWATKVGRGDFQALSFDGKGTCLAVVQTSKVVVLDTATGQVMHELAHEQYPTGPLSTAMSPDGNVCAVGYAPNSIGLWDAHTARLLRLIKAHGNWVVSLAFTPDGALLASSAGDTTASIWQVATGKELGRLRFGDGAAYVNSVSISDDGRWLAAGRRGEYAVREMPALLSQRKSDSPEKD
jgi:WD40 repeat protein